MINTMNEWFNRASDLLTVGERQTIKDLMNTLNPTTQEAISEMCRALYRLGNLNNTDIKPEPNKLSEETKKWLDRKTPEKRLELIKDMCVDWDGYRTAAGLGSLINEIWACAAYPCKNEAHIMSLEEIQHTTSETVWYESKPDNKLIQFNKKDIVALLFTGTLLNWSGFNKTWRIWDKEPTKEQMKETPWDCV